MGILKVKDNFMIKIKTGLDKLSENMEKYTKGKRVAVLAHGASVNKEISHIIPLLFENKVELVRIFGPEHGLYGAAQDMEAVSGSNKKTIDIISLYGPTKDSLKPKSKDLEGIDLLICDLQDVGSRYYTYIWTVVLTVMEALKQGVEVIVLDRPNPLGDLVEGNLQNENLLSFVGLYSVPVCHSLTIGEMVKYILHKENVSGDLTILSVENWKRSMKFHETDQPWVMPSPNMPTFDTALVYPGLCLLEGTNMSEGRGTTRPFEIFGAPYIDEDEFAKNFRQMDGVVLRPLKFTPSFQKHKGVLCGGVQIHITDKSEFSPYRLGLEIISTTIKLYPQEFEWRKEVYEFEEGKLAFDLLTGDENIRKNLENGVKPEKIIDENSISPEKWINSVSNFLLYS
jgi:uncharacterized protein YbbC (DUF1343 family)